MKKLIQFLCLSVFLLGFSACSEKQLHQEIGQTYPNGQAKSITYFTDEEKSDKVKTENFYEDGSIKDEIPFEGNKLDGIWIMYFQNGNKRIEGTYSDGLAHGPWKYYFETGELNAHGTASTGNWEGQYTWYYINGKKKKEGNYSKGWLGGDFTFYAEDGEITNVER